MPNSLYFPERNLLCSENGPYIDRVLAQKPIAASKTLSILNRHSYKTKGWEVEKQVGFLHSAATVIRARAESPVAAPPPQRSGRSSSKGRR